MYYKHLVSSTMLFRPSFTRTLCWRPRSFSSVKSATSTRKAFDEQLKDRQKHWALGIKDGTYYDYLREESVRRLVDRLEDITRDFPNALELGSYRGSLLKEISSNEGIRGKGGIGGIEHLTQCDSIDCTSDELYTSISPAVQSKRMVCDFEQLPFEPHSFDIVLSAMSLHWVNDLPSTLVQIKSVLKPDGAFIGSMLGGDTLKELKHCFYLADQERRGGLSPHTSPFARASDMAGLMQGAGFSLPTVDVDTIEISYPDAFTLMEHLALMGEGAASLNREFHVGKDTFLAVAALYQELYGLEDGSVSATFEIISFIGWSPHGSQQQPCKRGSATSSMKTI